MRLTAKQEGFIASYIEHGNASRAYKENYNAEKMTRGTIDVESFKLLNNPKIATKLSELRKKVDEEVVISVAQKKKWLQAVIEDAMQVDEKGMGMLDRKSIISSIAELNRMDGDLAAQKREITIDDKREDLLTAARKRLEQQASMMH